MRRDLAVSRDREGLRSSKDLTHENGIAPSNVVGQAGANVSDAELPKSTEPAGPPTSTESAGLPMSTSPTGPVKDSSLGALAKTDETSTVEAASTGDPKLAIETNALKEGAQPDEEKPPDTATMSANADLESLFNDPAGESGPGTGSAFNDDMNTNADFDFATFNVSLDNGADHDGSDGGNISALIPGLQDYSNETTADNDFNAMFASEGNPNGDVFSGFGVENQGNGKPEENFFDDFMDIQFDMSDTGKEGEGESQEFDFDFS